MMVLNDFALFGHLHDAVCNSLIWDCSSPTNRRIILSVQIDSEVEYLPWKGLSLNFTFSDVVLVHFLGWGCQIGDEIIDSFKEGVTDYFKSECNRIQKSGIYIPPFFSTIVFASGSTVELVYDKVSVDINVTP